MFALCAANLKVCASNYQSFQIRNENHPIGLQPIGWLIHREISLYLHYLWNPSFGSADLEWRIIKKSPQISRKTLGIISKEIPLA